MDEVRTGQFLKMNPGWIRES